MKATWQTIKSILILGSQFDELLDGIAPALRKVFGFPRTGIAADRLFGTEDSAIVDRDR